MDPTTPALDFALVAVDQPPRIWFCDCCGGEQWDDGAPGHYILAVIQGQTLDDAKTAFTAVCNGCAEVCAPGLAAGRAASNRCFEVNPAEIVRAHWRGGDC